MDRGAELLSGVENVLEAMPDAIIAVRPDGSIALANAAAERLFGMTRADVIGRPVEILVPDALQDAHQNLPIEISLSTADTAEGTVVIAAIRDVNERKSLEQRLRDQNAALELAVSTKDRFLGRMSHELRTPLNAILGFTGTLLMGLPGELNSEQRAQLETVRGAARRLLSLINDLLDLARIESGKVDLSLESVDCCAVVDAVAREFRGAAATKGLDLEVVCSDRAVHALADRRVLQHILVNLVDNAVRVTDSGHVRLTVDGGGPSGSMVRIAVADTGPGIDAAGLDRLLEPVPEVPQPVLAEDRAGLGLLISRLLAELLGGALRGSSTSGAGTTFTVELDRA